MNFPSLVLRLAALATVAVPLSGCLVVGVGSAAVGAAGVAVGVTAKAVGMTARAAGAAAGAVIPGGDKAKDAPASDR
jgi:hypothetical protein